MTIFPKWYVYNTIEPRSGLYPYEATNGTSLPYEPGVTQWDWQRFNLSFWRNLDACVDGLRALNVQADLILFHPYDHWGLNSCGTAPTTAPTGFDIDAKRSYLRYVLARLGAFSNVWWSLANEYDLMYVVPSPPHFP